MLTFAAGALAVEPVSSATGDEIMTGERSHGVATLLVRTANTRSLTTLVDICRHNYQLSLMELRTTIRYDKKL